MTSEINQPAAANNPPELKQVIGALLFAARKPIAANELREVLAQVNQNGEDATHAYGKIQESDIRTALEQLKNEFAERKLGLVLVEVAGGFRFQTDSAGGPWVRHLLNLDKPAHLSKPALETLAIIAYRQPTTRAEIEALRGVNVDAMMRHLLELQLIRIVGRSDLPGRPLMYGTTQLFLEHFGLSSVKNLPGVEQLSRRDAERVKREAGDRQPITDNGAQPAQQSPESESITPEDGAPAGANTEKIEAADKAPDEAEKTEPDAEDEYDEDEDEDEDEDGDGDEDDDEEDDEVEGRN